ncbi:uncharacterized protein BDZ99DRAFT_277958 [Mytilinidion resinicola]|uniref:Uncharacterized protein n=1 Tax=Mytilinidion resinicola TaxID=574789 RepID=A0A6A6YSW5_9PEZI|nr:uncharacterized protein BDZ99DRAFT_277958 [Mytilinidion resinicola]KAF2811609.1 hypothetical protein BDZ99DRAFT_277958 [Mytilinidion resinicola]
MQSNSSGTSFTSVAHTSAADAFATLLMTNDEIRSLCVSGVTDCNVGPLRLERNLPRLLYQYSKDLREEAVTPAQLTAVELFQSRSRLQHIASKVRRTVNGDSERLALPNEPLDPNASIQRYLDEQEGQRKPLDIKNKDISAGSSSSDDEQDAEINEPRDFNVQSLAAFLSNSIAFQLLQQNLRDFVFPKISGELDRISQRILRHPRVLSNKDIAVLQGVIYQLRQADPASISVSDHQASVKDKWKIKMEQLCGSSWDWWPIQEPIYPTRPGHIYILWQCVSLRRWLLLTSQR